MCMYIYNMTLTEFLFLLLFFEPVYQSEPFSTVLVVHRTLWKYGVSGYEFIDHMWKISPQCLRNAELVLVSYLYKKMF